MWILYPTLPWNNYDADIKMIAAQIDSVINRDHHAQGPYSGNCHRREAEEVVQRCKAMLKSNVTVRWTC
jgi:hypothetical protein